MNNDSVFPNQEVPPRLCLGLRLIHSVIDNEIAAVEVSILPCSEVNSDVPCEMTAQWSRKAVLQVERKMGEPTHCHLIADDRVLQSILDMEGTSSGVERDACYRDPDWWVLRERVLEVERQLIFALLRLNEEVWDRDACFAIRAVDAAAVACYLTGASHRGDILDMSAMPSASKYRNALDVYPYSLLHDCRCDCPLSAGSQLQSIHTKWTAPFPEAA